MLEYRAKNPGLHAEVHQVIVEGDRVAYVWMMRMKDEQDKLKKVIGITVLHLEDGKIREDRFIAADVQKD
jgi:hypothetical protein